MKPKPFSSLNHLTVPVAMHSSTAVFVLRHRGSYIATVCERLHCFRRMFLRPNVAHRTTTTGGATMPGRFFSGFSQALDSRRCRHTEAVASPRRRLLLAAAAGLALADASIVTLALPRLLSELHA